MYSAHQAPPVLPPKPAGSHDASRISTPSLSQSPRPPPRLPPEAHAHAHAGDLHTLSGNPLSRVSQPQPVPDPGDQWLPKYLEDKSKQDLQTILTTPSLLTSLTHAPNTIHPSLSTSQTNLSSALAENIALATHLLTLEQHVISARASTSAQILSTRQLERTWRAKQAEMDAALAPFAPASLYQRLVADVAEQEGVCKALEESFLDGQKGEVAGEREVGEWVKGYREAKKLAYLRRERKERWDEGRVGGWR